MPTYADACRCPCGCVQGAPLALPLHSLLLLSCFVCQAIHSENPSPCRAAAPVAYAATVLRAFAILTAHPSLPLLWLLRDHGLSAPRCSKAPVPICSLLSPLRPTSLSSSLTATCLQMHGQSVCFVVMESLFYSALRIDEKYDLKGSWVDRSNSKAAESSGSRPGSRHEQTSLPTRKDNDLTCKLTLPHDQREVLRAQCAADADMLHSLNIMDYSLLLGIHYPGINGNMEKTDSKVSDAATANSGNSSPFVYTAGSPGGDAVYYVCMIDLLQTWTVAKRLERWLKMLLCCRCGNSASGMSVVEPKQYAERFVRMIDRILDR